MKPVLAAAMLSAALWVLLAGCYEFTNPVDPEAPNYSGPPASPPDAPVSLTASNGAEVDPEHEVTLTWVDKSDNEEGFRLERRTSGQFSVIADLDANVTTYTDSTLSGDTTYVFRVFAYNDYGSSEPSNEVVWTTPPP